MTRTEHLLTIVAEECNEVAQRCTKALRFGMTEIQPEQALTNAERIAGEYSDLVAALILLRRECPGLIPDITDEALEAKRQKIERSLEYSASVGTLESAALTEERDEIKLRESAVSEALAKVSEQRDVATKERDEAWETIKRALRLKLKAQGELETSKARIAHLEGGLRKIKEFARSSHNEITWTVWGMANAALYEPVEPPAPDSIEKATPCTAAASDGPQSSSGSLR